MLKVLNYLLMCLEFRRFFPGAYVKKTLTRRTYHWIKSVAGLELKALSPYFFSKLQITYTAFSVKLMCKTLRSKVDHLYRVTICFLVSYSLPSWRITI